MRDFAGSCSELTPAYFQALLKYYTRSELVRKALAPGARDCSAKELASFFNLEFAPRSPGAASARESLKNFLLKIQNEDSRPE
ncbi:MAG: hypothetical protein ABIN66_05805, partial [candidate division WOR-3 bacterium]